MNVIEHRFPIEVIGARQVLSNLDIVQYRDELRDAVVFELRAKAASRFIERVDVTTPLTWWDAVKQRFAPRWWLRRWPARTKTRSYEVREYAHALALPPGRSSIAFVSLPPIA